MASILTGKLEVTESEENRQFVVENNNHTKLNQYIFERK